MLAELILFGRKDCLPFALFDQWPVNCYRSVVMLYCAMLFLSLEFGISAGSTWDFVFSVS